MRTHERIGWGLTGIFGAGSLINAVVIIASGKALGGFKVWLFDSSYIFMIPFCSIFYLTTKYERLKFLHVVVALGYGVFNGMTSPQSVLGVFSYAIGVALMFRYRYFDKHFLWKVIPMLAVLVTLLPVSAYMHGMRKSSDLGDLAIIPVAFFIAIYAIFKDQIDIYINPPKQKRVVIMAEYNVKGSEATILQCYIKGMQDKEALEIVHRDFQGINSVSTIAVYRDRAVKKLGYSTPSDFLRDLGNIELV